MFKAQWSKLFTFLLLLFVTSTLSSFSVFPQQSKQDPPPDINVELEARSVEQRDQLRLFQKERGRDEQFLELIPYIKYELFRSEEVSPSHIMFAQSQAFRLSAHGLDRSSLQILKRQNIDLLISMGEITAPPKLANRVAISDVIVRGIVEEVVDDSSPQDGYRASIIVKILEIYKGDYQLEHIAVRRLSGRDSDEFDVSISHDFMPNIGEEYILFLSNILYQYFIQHPSIFAKVVNKEVATQYADIYYVRSQMPYKLKCDQVFSDVITMQMNVDSLIKEIRYLVDLIEDAKRYMGR